MLMLSYQGTSYYKPIPGIEAVSVGLEPYCTAKIATFQPSRESPLDLVGV